MSLLSTLKHKTGQKIQNEELLEQENSNVSKNANFYLRRFFINTQQSQMNSVAKPKRNV